MKDINVDFSSFLMPDIREIPSEDIGSSFNDLATLKDKIEMHRRRRKLTEVEFSKRVGISRVTYWRFKKGLVDGISVDVLFKMLEVLGIEVLLLRKEDVLDGML